MREAKLSPNDTSATLTRQVKARIALQLLLAALSQDGCFKPRQLSKLKF
jgi:hypothetical protein